MLRRNMTCKGKREERRKNGGRGGRERRRNKGKRGGMHAFRILTSCVLQTLIVLS